MIQFISAAQRSLYEDKLIPWTEELFGHDAVPSERSPSVIVPMGSAMVHVGVTAVGDETFIYSRAYVVSGLDASNDLMRFLLEQNARGQFGAFGLDEDGTVVLEHVIVGATCDPPELEASIRKVAAAADRYDDEIVSRWGGVRAIERGW